MSTWTYRSRVTDTVRTGELTLHWHVEGAAISDGYFYSDKDEFALFDLWAERGRNEEVAITWTVGEEGEVVPFQLHLGDKEEGFLDFWTHPVDEETGAYLNWLTLPVADGVWNSSDTTSGGFIQEATGWKPSPLQPTVLIRALHQAVEARRPARDDHED